MNISKTNCMDLISEKFPDFAPIWYSYNLEYQILNEEIFGITPFWGDTSFAGGISKFSDYVIDLLIHKKQNLSLIEEIFNYIEFLLVNGDEDVQNTVATCFLENILNITPEQIDPKLFVGYLGFKSRKYCQAWDEFKGVKTEGL